MWFYQEPWFWNHGSNWGRKTKLEIGVKCLNQIGSVNTHASHHENKMPEPSQTHQKLRFLDLMSRWETSVPMGILNIMDVHCDLWIRGNCRWIEIRWTPYTPEIGKGRPLAFTESSLYRPTCCSLTVRILPKYHQKREWFGLISKKS